MSILIQDIPERLFKYYAYDDKYNSDRLSGKVFLTNPYSFNDPSDCRLGVTNNYQSMGKDEIWLAEKLKELGINPQTYLDRVIDDEKDAVELVWKKQLEKVGILCLSQDSANKLLWGYYTNNAGFCIELDSSLIVERLLLGYINGLNFETIFNLYNGKGYSSNPIMRNANKNAAEITKAVELVSHIDIAKITNPYLLSLLKDAANEEPVRNFLITCLLKRFGCHEMTYVDANDVYSAKLFFNGSEEDVIAKYYRKTKEWSLEKEFRIVTSLGGRILADLGCDIIKSVRIGCNMSASHVFEVLSILQRNKMNNIPVYRMKVNTGTNTLEPVLMDSYSLYSILSEFNKFTNI